MDPIFSEMVKIDSTRQRLKCFTLDLLQCLPVFAFQSSIYTTIGALSPKSVFTNLSSKFDRFLTVQCKFDTNHRVNFSTPTCRISATFGPLAVCVCPLFFTAKKKKKFASPQLRFLDAIFMWQFSRRCRHRRLLKKTAHDIARLRTTTHNYA